MLEMCNNIQKVSYIYIHLNETTMTTATKKAKDLQVGDSFISRGSKMKVARIKSSNETSVNLFCLSYIMSSYITVIMPANEDVFSF